MEYGLRSKKRKQILFVSYIVFMIISAIIAMQAATQYLAYHLSYQKALGKYLFFAFDRPIYPFWNIFAWNTTQIQGVYSKAVQLGQVVFLAPQAVFIGVLLFCMRPKGNKKLHGSARWANEKEIKSMGYFEGKGVYVGGWQGKKNEEIHYLRHNGAEHLMCFAPTRSGKGVGLILPTLLSWQDSALILDIKGENWALTSGYRKSLGHKVLRFDPTDTSHASCRFNPIEEIRLFSLHAVQDVQNMALMIVDSDGKGLPDHWTKAAFAFFSGVILHCCVMVQGKEKRSATLQDVALMMSGYNYAEGIKSLFQEMVQMDHGEILRSLNKNCSMQTGEEIHAFVASTALEMQSKADTEASGVLSSALVTMSLYKDPIITQNTSACDFRIADLMNHESPVSLYLVLSPASIDRVRPLVRLMMDMIIRRVCSEMSFKDGASTKGYKHRLLLMFDEFTSLGKLPIVEKAIAYMAGYGGKLFLIVQDINQLNAVYGKENALMANCHIRIAYAPNSIETAKILSDMTGKTTVVDRKLSISYSKSGRSTTESISETGRNLLTPDECMRLPNTARDSDGKITNRGDMIILTAGEYPIYGTKILYYEDPIFLERAKIPMPLSSDFYPSGVSDSLYFSPRARSLTIAKHEKMTVDLNNYLKE